MNIGASEVLEKLWAQVEGDQEALDQVQLEGSGLIMPSSFRVADLAQGSIAASTLATAELIREKSDRRPQVTIDRRHATAEFHSEGFFREVGKAPTELWDPIAGTYECGDGRFVRLHTNFAHHRDGVLELLGCENEREAVAAALKGWNAEDFETEACNRKLVVSMMRSFDEWDAHPHGQATRHLPAVLIEKITDAPPKPLPEGGRPLSNIRVLDLTRIIAGPVCGRTLAVHGADVMRISAPHLPYVGMLVKDAGRGKLAAHVDLREEAGKDRLRKLIRRSDVLVQGYRPGGLAERDFSPEQLAELNPSMIYASLSAYSHKGPWSWKRGFDSLVQTTSGFNDAEGKAAGLEGPKPLPCQALDHASGYLLALGVQAALLRRAREGGSWHVRVALLSTGYFLRSLGQDASRFDCPPLTSDDVQDLMEGTHSGFGPIRAIKHSGLIEGAAPYYNRLPVPLGTHAPVWP